MIDFLASQGHYFHHLAPIWFALPPEERGTFYAVDKAASQVQAEVGEHFKRTYPTTKGPLTVVASYNDFRVAHRAGRKVVLLNHGAGQSYCLAPETRVLTSDLRWRPIDQLHVGQELIGFEEEPGDYYRWRSWKRTYVEQIQWVKLPSYRITLADGTKIVCSGDHKWLRRENATYGWKPTSVLRQASTAPLKSSKLLKSFDVWEEDRSWSAGYLAAAFDGEGCFTQTSRTARQNRVALSFTQKDNPMLDAVAKELRSRHFQFTISRFRADGVMTLAVTGGLREAFRFLGTIRPRRLMHNFKPPDKGQMRAQPVEILSIEPIGEQTLVGLTTSTGTFYAEGFASHNSGALKNHGAYAGGSGRKDVALFLEPGPYAGQLTRDKGGNVVEVGVPSIDCFHENMLNRRMWEETLRAWLVQYALQPMATPRQPLDGEKHSRPIVGTEVLEQGQQGNSERLLDLDGLHDEDGLRAIQDARRRIAVSPSGSVVFDLRPVAHGQAGSPLSQLRQIMSSWTLQTPSMRESSTSEGLQPKRESESRLHSLFEGASARGSGIGRISESHQWQEAVSALSSREASQWATIAVSWHWHCVSGVPETDWAWPEYKDAVVELSKHYKVIGHAHPRAWQRMERWYREVGIEPVESFREVLSRACVYVCDNSSTLYEFASAGKPVVVLNSRYYRRDQEHGLRFWSLVPGPQVDYPQDLRGAVESALISDPSPYQSVIEKVYHSTDGKAAERAAKAILELGATMDPYKPKRKAQIPERKPDPPQFPLARLKRIGASTREIEAAREVWDSMGSEEEQFAAAAEFDAMGDVELRGALAEQQEVPKFSELTIPQVLDHVGNSRQRAKQALDAERAREAANEGRARSTLVAALQRIIDA